MHKVYDQKRDKTQKRKLRDLSEGRKEKHRLIDQKRDQTAKRNFFCSAVFLGLAAWCKYPALLLLFPLFMTIKNPIKHALPILVGFLGVWGMGEIFLYLSYGKFQTSKIIHIHIFANFKVPKFEFQLILAF